MIALFNKYFSTPSTDECVLKLSLDDFTNHPSVLAIKWIARLRSTFHSTQSEYLVLLYLLQIWTLWHLLAQMDYGQNCPAPVIAGPQQSSSCLKRVNMVNYGERMKDGKFLSSVKQMWKWNDKDVTSVSGTKKNLSPRQESNLWPPKHRAGGLSTWARKNSWRARPYTYFN